MARSLARINRLARRPRPPCPDCEAGRVVVWWDVDDDERGDAFQYPEPCPRCGRVPMVLRFCYDPEVGDAERRA